VFLIAGAHAARAGVNVWTTHGPYGGRSVFALVIDPATPSTLYAGIDGGVYRSTDSGARWTATGLTNANVQALAIDPRTPSTLYAGTNGGGVFRDVDGCGSGPPDDRIDFGTSYCETYRSCSAGVQVELCSIEASLVSAVPGHVLYFNPEIDVARTAWEFLSQFRLPAQR
jgi:photosystem II stability/assembly factor-like uncharacterized protein